MYYDYKPFEIKPDGEYKPLPNFNLPSESLNALLPQEIIEDGKWFLFSYNKCDFACHRVYAEEQKDFLQNYFRNHPDDICHNSNYNIDFPLRTLEDFNKTNKNSFSVKCGELVDCFLEISKEDAKDLYNRGLNNCSIYFYSLMNDNYNYTELHEWMRLCDKYWVQF